jgi:hypothetical protein
MTWDDPLDPVVITVQEIASGSRAALVVRHEEGHGGWQVLDGADVSGRKPVVVPKEAILSMDPSLVDVIDLPVGWRASRAAAGAPWSRTPIG